MNPPLTDLSHSIDKLELCLGSLSKGEDCYTVLAAEIERLKAVEKKLRATFESIDNHARSIRLTDNIPVALFTLTQNRETALEIQYLARSAIGRKES